MSGRLIPELDVDDLDASLRFYCEVLGFEVLYERPEEGFAFLDLAGAQLMLQTASGPGRRFRTALLERPYGRGVNFQIQVEDAADLYESVCHGGWKVVIALEESWYGLDNGREGGNRQFVVEDPDGYLLRCFTDLGERTASDARS
jgi:catechol 2,3-dioxygenase-like lactoylglutathione lyase family enzyme